MDPLKSAKDAAKALKDQAGDATSKARAASHANIQFKHGDTSFSAGAGADAGAAAGASTDAQGAKAEIEEHRPAAEIEEHASGEAG